MTEKELNEYIDQMKKYTEKVKFDKKLSLEVLVKAGVYNKSGQLETIYK